MKWSKLNPKLKRRLIDENPEALDSNGIIVAGLRPQKPVSCERGEGADRGVEESQDSIRFCITLTVFRKRELDAHDKAPFALRPLVDRITECLGFSDDSDPRLEWNYRQVKSKVQYGTHVLITQYES